MLVFVGFLCLASTALAYPDSLRAEGFKAKAIAFLEEDNWKEAEQFKAQAIEIYQANDDLKNWIHLHRRLGQTLRTKANYEQAISFFQTAIEQGWRMPDKNPEHVQRAWAFADIGYTYKRLNNFRALTREYESALAIFQNDIGKEDRIVAQYIYSELGNGYNRLRDYDKAAFYLRRVKEIYEQEEVWEKIPEAFNDLGMVYLNTENYIEAIRAFSEGLNQEAVTFYDQLLLLPNLSDAYLQNGDFEKALFYNRQCEQLIGQAELTDKERAEELFWLRLHFGSIYEGLGDFEKANDYYTQAIQSMEKYNPDDLRIMAQSYLYRADFFTQTQQSEKALSDYSTALEYLLPEYNAEQLPLPQSYHLIDEPNLIEAFGGMAANYIRQYQQSKDIQLFEHAHQCYQLAQELEQKLIQSYIIEGTQLTALEEHRWVREAHLSFLYDVWKKDSLLSVREQLFSLSEQSRAFLLLQDQQRALQFENPVLDSLKQYYFQSSETILELEEALYFSKKENTIHKDSLLLALMKEREVRAKLTKQIEESLPQLNLELPHQNDLATLQKELSEEQVVLEYFLGAEKLFVFRITKDDFLLIQLSLPAELTATIDTLRKTMQHPLKIQDMDYVAQFKKSSHQLYDYLLAEALSDLPANKNRLTIIPDGILATIPFHLLLMEEAEAGDNYTSFPYLLRNYAISYAPSSHFLLPSSNRKVTSSNPRFAGFAPSYNAVNIAEQDTSGQTLYAGLVRDGIYALPEASNEVAAIHKLLGGDLFMEQKASELNFKKEAGKYDLLLLSMHSLLDPQQPNFTQLLFTKAASGDQEDDVMYAQELQRIELHADLVVLSACNTGYGKLQVGEGIMSLARSFFAVGTPSIVASQWKVPDSQTKVLMELFFSNLKKGLPKDRALQQANLEYLNQVKSLQKANPYYWGGFMAAGDMHPMYNPSSFDNRFKWLIGILLICVGLYLYKKRGIR